MRVNHRVNSIEKAGPKCKQVRHKWVKLQKHPQTFLFKFLNSYNLLLLLMISKILMKPKLFWRNLLALTTSALHLVENHKNSSGLLAWRCRGALPVHLVGSRLRGLWTSSTCWGTFSLSFKVHAFKSQQLHFSQDNSNTHNTSGLSTEAQFSHVLTAHGFPQNNYVDNFRTISLITFRVQ